MAGLLEGHIAAITGSGSGIGRAIAVGYAREGAQVIGLDMNGEAAAETTKAAFTADPVAFHCQPLARRRRTLSMRSGKAATPAQPKAKPSRNGGQAKRTHFRKSLCSV